MTGLMDVEFRRRLDEILDPAYVAGVVGITDDDLRRKLRLAREEEDDLSYVRRRLHGMLDILKAEVEARRMGRGTIRGVDALQEALGEGSSDARPTRGARPTAAARAVSSAGRRRAECIASEAHLARLPELGVSEIVATIDRVGAEERDVSLERRRLHEVIDVLEGELASRYKRGLKPPV